VVRKQSIIIGRALEIPGGTGRDSCLTSRRYALHALSSALGIVLRHVILQSENTTPPRATEVNDFGLTWQADCHGINGPVQNGYDQYHYPQNSESLKAPASTQLRQIWTDIELTP
jgi:hypothetical protein